MRENIKVDSLEEYVVSAEKEIEKDDFQIFKNLEYLNMNGSKGKLCLNGL